MSLTTHTAITVVFLVLGIVAAALHFSYLTEVTLDRRALNVSDIRGELARRGFSRTEIFDLHTLADQVIESEFSRLIINLIVLAIGLGTLFTHYEVLWLLIGIPILSTISSWVKLRRRWFPRRRPRLDPPDAPS